MAPRIPPVATPAAPKPSALASTPIASSGPTPGTKRTAAAPSRPPASPPATMPFTAPWPSFVSGALVITPPATASSPRMAEPNFLLVEPRPPQLVQGELGFVAAFEDSDQCSSVCTRHEILLCGMPHACGSVPPTKRPTWRNTLGHCA